MKKIAFYTLGCKVNQADTASMERLFAKAKYDIVPFTSPADVYVVNTCVVTNMGQSKSRKIINRAVRNNPDALVVVTGCYPQTAPEEVKAIAGVDLLVGNQNRSEIVELVEEALKSPEKIDAVKPLTKDTVFEDLVADVDTEKTRAFLKIQEGCNQFCTYCIIPYARGPLRSRSLESITKEVEQLVEKGFKEVVLLGIHLGAYGHETKDKTLVDAVKAALSVKGLERLRLGSLESIEIQDELLELMKKDKRFCNHLHLPLQAGSNTVLERMHRPYDTKVFLQTLEKVRKVLPDVAITTDIIVGFPGETKEEFQETLAFAQKAGFAKIHIFPFSKRKGTPAEKMPEQISPEEKQLRASALATIDEKGQKAFLEQNLGKTTYVLFEQPLGKEWVEGLTSNYLRIKVKGPQELCGRVQKVKIIGLEEDLLVGTCENKD